MQTRTLPQTSAVNPNYKPQRLNKAIKTVGKTIKLAFYNVHARLRRWCVAMRKGDRLSQTLCDVINYEMGEWLL